MENGPPVRRIWITCPTCHKKGAVPIDKRVVEGALEAQGDPLLQVHVFAGEVCDHAFTVTVDANLKARSTE